MKTKTVNLPALPSNWNYLTLDQFKKIEKIRGNFVSEDSYLTHCFLELEGLKPLRYAERWREALAVLPFLGRFVWETGRQIADVHENPGDEGKPLIIWKQCYSFKGFWLRIFGPRFFVEDQEILSFQEKLNYLLKPESISLKSNPVREKRIGLKTYRSYQTLLSDMSWLSYNKCSMFIKLYSQTKNESYLNKFLSILYKAENVKHFERKFSVFEKRLVLLFWDGTQSYFLQSFPHLFKKRTETLSKDFMKEESAITVFLGKESFSKPEDVRDMMVFDALQYLELNAVLCEEKERQIQRMKRH